MSLPPDEPPLLLLEPLAPVPPPLLLPEPNAPPSPLLSLLQPHGGSGWGLRQPQTDPGPPAVQAPSHRPAAATSAPEIHGFRLLSTPIAPTDGQHSTCHRARPRNSMGLQTCLLPWRSGSAQSGTTIGRLLIVERGVTGEERRSSRRSGDGR